MLMVFTFLFSGILAILFGLLTVFKFGYRKLSHNQKYHLVRGFGTGVVAFLFGLMALSDLPKPYFFFAKLSVKDAFFVSFFFLFIGIYMIYESREIRRKFFQKPMDFETYLMLMGSSIGGVFFASGLITAIVTIILYF